MNPFSELGTAQLPRIHRSWYFAFLLAYIATILNLLLYDYFPVLRFEQRELNDWTFLLLVITVSPAVLISAVFAWAGRTRVLAVLLPSVPISLTSFLAYVLLMFTVVPIFGHESRVVLQELSCGKSRLVTYRQGGNATIGFSVDVRQELNLLPGIILVKRLLFEDHRSNARIEVLPGRRVRITLMAYGDEYPQEERISTLAWLP